MRRLSDYQAIIVDMDGTLYYQKPVRLAMIKEMLFHFWRLPDFIIVQKYRKMYEKGFSERERFDHLPVRAPQVIREWMIERPLKYIKKYKDSILINILHVLRQNKVIVYIYSDYPTDEKIAFLDIHVDNTYCSDDLSCMKPNASGMHNILMIQGISGNNVLVIGDRQDKDGLFAENLGADKLILPPNFYGRRRYYLYMMEDVFL